MAQGRVGVRGWSGHPGLTTELRNHFPLAYIAPPLPKVRRLLCSSRPIALRPAGTGSTREPLEADPAHEQQARLALLCRRVTALGVGRGMFTLASAQAERVQNLKLAPLVLQGHTSPKGATIELDTSALGPDHLLWPDYHNGCACALRLSPPGCGPVAHGELGRHWIMYSRPRARQHAYAGFLMGLGLQGHLVALANTDIYRFMSQVRLFCRLDVLAHRCRHECCGSSRALAVRGSWGLSTSPSSAGTIARFLYSHHLNRIPTSAVTATARHLVQGHDVTMMSMLIGMSAARRGSMHPAIAKMLCLHIPALHPPSFTELELEVPALVQIAALLGIGLLYQVHNDRPWQPHRCAFRCMPHSLDIHAVALLESSRPNLCAALNRLPLPRRAQGSMPRAAETAVCIGACIQARRRTSEERKPGHKEGNPERPAARIITTPLRPASNTRQVARGL